MNTSAPEAASCTICKAYDIGWKPVQYLNNVSIGVGSVLTPAGLDKSVGLITTAYLKEPNDKQFANDPAMTQWREFMKKYYPDGSPIDNLNVYGYSVGQTIAQVLRQCGDNLTRENVMRQAASLQKYRVDTLLPGVLVSTAADDFAPIESVQLQRFDGKEWVRFGEVMGGR